MTDVIQSAGDGKAFAIPIAAGLLGAYAGSFVGMAAIGYAIGSGLASYLMQPDGPHTEGPRLADLSAQSANYGAALPRIVGRMRLSGSVIEAFPAVEHPHNQSSGKGGSKSSSTTYTYTRTFAVALSEGEADFFRAWIDKNLEFTRDASAGYDAAVHLISQDGQIVFYSGSETQLPDPTLAGLHGYTPPAYRGTSYIVFIDRDVTNSGGRLPLIELELQAAGSRTHTFGPYATPALLSTDFQSPATGSKFILIGLNDGVLDWQNGWIRETRYAGKTLRRLTQQLSTTIGYRTPMGDGKSVLYTTYGNALGSFQWLLLDTKTGELQNITHLGNYYGGINVTPFGGYCGNKWYCCGSQSNFAFFKSGGLVTPYSFINTNDTNAYIRITGIWSDGIACAIIVSSSGVKLLKRNGASYFIPSPPNQVLTVNQNAGVIPRQIINGNLLNLNTTTNKIESWYLASDNSAWILEWESTYTVTGPGADVLITELVPKKSYALNSVGSNQIWIYDEQGLTSKTGITLDQVLREFTAEGGLIDLQDFDASACSGISLIGAARTAPMSPRSAIQPLLDVWQIDPVEADGKIKYIPRGTSATIPIDPLDLGVVDYGSAPIGTLTSTRTQTAELPQEIALSYQDSSRDGQPGLQRAIRQDVANSTKVSRQLAVQMSPDDAAQRADVMMKVAWRERNQRMWRLPSIYAGLTPGDVIGWAGYQLRIARIDGSIPGILEMHGNDAVPADYSSSAKGDVGTPTNQTISLRGPTELRVLDIPALRDADADSSGVYLAATGWLPGWPGCAIQRSIDDGATWATISGSNQAVTQGVTTSVLAPGPSTVIDRFNSVTISLDYGSLYSITEAALLDLGNLMLIGDELVAFSTATLNADSTYTIKNLLRGLFGTEEAIGTHLAGDRVIFVEVGTWGRQPEPVGLIGSNINYRAPTLGAYADTAETVQLPYTARSAKPWAVANIRIRKQTTGITVDWRRRSRYLGSWQTDYCPLGEASEQYEVLLLDVSGNQISSTVVTSPTFQFVPVGTEKTIRIYQLSASIGRGMPAEAPL